MEGCGATDEQQCSQGRGRGTSVGEEQLSRRTWVREPGCPGVSSDMKTCPSLRSPVPPWQDTCSQSCKFCFSSSGLCPLLAKASLTRLAQLRASRSVFNS